VAHPSSVSSNKGTEHVGPRRKGNSYKPERRIVLFYEMEEEKKKENKEEEE
jgi:hypothetical protein